MVLNKTVEDSNQFEDELDYEDDTNFKQVADLDNYPIGDGIRALVEGDKTPVEDVSSDEDEDIQEEQVSIVSSVDKEVILRQPRQVVEQPAVQLSQCCKIHPSKLIFRRW